MSTTTQAGEHPPHAGQPEEERRPWTVLGLMLAAQFMVVLDVSVVNVALPSIGADLHLSSAAYQWTVSAYVLLSGGLLLLGGRMADLFDRRRMFALGLTLFTGASLASGLADSSTALVVSRAAQGAGAALLTPAAMSVVMTTYAGKQRAAALAVWGTVASMGIAAGVLFGGLLTSMFDWRAVFFINVPIGVAVLVGTLRAVPAGTGAGAGLRGLDRHGWGHWCRRRRDLPQLPVPPAGPRLLRGGHRAAVPAARCRHHAERRGRLQAPAARRAPGPDRCRSDGLRSRCAAALDGRR
jgi:MFS family permease